MAAMSLYEHWLADCATRHQAAVRAARALPPASLTGRSPGEAELSRLSVSLFERMHTLPDLVAEHGAMMIFTPPAEAIPPEEVRKLLHLPP